MLRPFTITDLGFLATYNKHALFLHNKLALTRGPAALMRAAWVSPLAAFTGTFTYICAPAGDGRGLIGQATHKAGSIVAHCTFLAPSDALASPQLAQLLERLLVRVGERGAQSLLADVEEDSRAFAALRQVGFSSYARQRVWQLTVPPRPSENAVNWRPAFSRDEITVDLLRNALLPSQVQQIESQSSKLEGYVYYREGQLQAYTEVERGPRGLWVQPFVNLDAEKIDQVLTELISKLRPRPSRPVYFSLRSYQDWLEDALRDLGAQPGPRQAAMARRTAIPLKAEEARRIPVANRRTEPTTPIHALIVSQHREPERMTYDQTPNYR